MARLKEIYNSEIREAMQQKFGYKNVMEIPKLEKIVINMGVGEAKENAKVLDSAVKDMETISGQHAIITKARKSILTSSSVRECLSDARLHFAVRRCTILLIVLSTFHFLVYVTSEVLTLTHSTEEETMLSDLRSSLYSLRSSSIR